MVNILKEEYKVLMCEVHVALITGLQIQVYWICPSYSLPGKHIFPATQYPYNLLGKF